MFCPQCGKENSDGITQCQWCGYIFAPTSTAIDTKLPDGIKGWSWPAFLWTWIWAIGNKTWIGLVTLMPVPFLPSLMAIVLGAKGREWAWKNNQWESVDQFNRVQRRWVKWWFLLVIPVTGIAFAIGILSLLNPTKQANQARDIKLKNDAHQLANGIIYYYSKNAIFPWNLSRSETSQSFNSNTSHGSDWINRIVAGGDLKESTTYVLDALVVFKPVNSSDIYVCYQPQSENAKIIASLACTDLSTPTDLQKVKCANEAAPLACEQ